MVRIVKNWRMTEDDPYPRCGVTWEAPLLLPDWRPMTPSLPWRICSSEKFLSFLVAILGPREGPVYSGWFWVARPGHD